tara:strand:+ start:133 stop:648 length:516 start_codon:yes stop_codon:yes gene_type:complete
MISKLFSRYFILFFFCIFCFNSFSHENVAYINLDYILNNSIIGKKIITKLNLIKEKDLNQIKILEKDLKRKEEKLLKEKNLLSKEVFQKNLDVLKNEINVFKLENIEKNKNFQKIKKNEFDIFLNNIQPILNKYMKENSINILLDKKNIFIGKSNLDLTEKILNIVDLELK